MANVSLKNVYKYYENSEKPAVTDFNLEIKDREFVVFVGPSGCGKSTTLRMIAGLEDISEGTISIDGKVVNTVEPMNRDIAMVFQNYALYPHMTVYNNMAFGLKQRKLLLPKIDKNGNQVKDANGEIIYVKRHYSKKEIDEKVKEASRILELDEYLQRKPKALSGGQRQRVAIGRSIVRSPKVFLMDEPLSNLDAKLRNQMRSEIIQLRKKIQTTFVYVTHDQIEAMTLGDRIVIMKDGIIQQVGTPLEVFNHPTNLFVACFIGTPQMNIFDGMVNDDYSISLLDGKLSLNEKYIKLLKKRNYKNKPIKIGVRPEHIILTEKEDGFSGDIYFSEMMGSEYYLHLNNKDNKIIIKAAIAGLNDDQKQKIESYGTIKFKFIEKAIHLFDSETENAISEE